MDIATLSILSKQSQVITDVNIALLSKNLDTISQVGNSLIKMMEQSVLPNVGQNIDIKL